MQQQECFKQPNRKYYFLRYYKQHFNNFNDLKNKQTKKLTQLPCPQGKSLRHRRRICSSNTADNLFELMPDDSSYCIALLE